MKNLSTGILSFTSATALGLVTVFGGGSAAFAATGNSSKAPYVDEIIKMEPRYTAATLQKEAEQIAQTDNTDVDQVLKQIYTELKRDADLAKKEQEELGFQTMGGNKGGLRAGKSKKGNYYYTPSSTAYLNHGHVGLYYSSKVIVESVPGKGVRKIKATKRKVDKGGSIRSISTTAAKKKAAVNWANSRVGKDKYSYNFATNRKTSHYGAKNCSKLIWSGFLLKAKLDLDKDKGAGVYPRDVRDAPKTKHVRKFKKA